MRESLTYQLLSGRALRDITAIIRHGLESATYRMVSLSRGRRRGESVRGLGCVWAVAGWHFLARIRESWGARDGAKTGRESRSAAGGSMGPLPPAAVADRFPPPLCAWEMSWLI